MRSALYRFTGLALAGVIFKSEFLLEDRISRYSSYALTELGSETEFPERRTQVVVGSTFGRLEWNFDRFDERDARG